MHFKKITSALLSGVLTLATAASSFSAVAPSLNATAADGDNYAKLLQYSLYLYDANMCGDTSDCGLSWRGNCHMNDDVVGGYHDAGDHVWFGQPGGYAASILGWSYYEFKDSYVATGQDAHLKVITDRFAKFMRSATKLNGDTVSSVLIEKGEGGPDHDYWGPPEKQGNRGRMLWSTGNCANIAAEYAAALAANYVNFGNPDDLKYAKALYKFAKSSPGAYSCEFYSSGESGTADEIAWAACWLYLATKDNTYMGDVQNAPDAWWVMNWENVALGAAVLKGEITGDWSSAHELDKFNGDGYKFYSKWGSARYNANAQMCSLVAAKHGKGNASWAKGQMAYLTGDKAFQNGQTHCLVVGFKDNSSRNPHHRAASPEVGADPGQDGTPNKYLLVGALCGGPVDESGSYADKRSDYVGNEVALDYNAGFVGAAAGLYSFYKTGSIVSTIEGVTKIYGAGNTQPVQTTTSQQPVQTTTTTQWQQPVQTTTTTQWQQPATTTTQYNPSTNNNGEYSITPNTRVTFDQNADDKMIGWDWADFNIPSGAKVTKVEVKLTANGNLGKWVGAFGTSTTEAPDYWTMSEEMEQTTNGNSATITWNVPSSTANIIQYSYGGQLKFGTWWIENSTFTVESIKVYTTGGNTTPVVTTTTTRATTTTTTTRATTTTQPPVQTTTTTAPKQQTNASKYGDVNLDGYVSISDAVAILQFIANRDKYNLNAQQLANADVSGNNDGVTANDALTIQKVDAGVYSQSQLPIR